MINTLDPFGVLFVEGHIYFYEGQYEKVLGLLREVVDFSPDFVVGLLVFAAHYARLGMLCDAQWQLFDVPVIDPHISDTNID